MNENNYISIPVSTLDELAAVGRAMVALTERLKRVAQPRTERVVSVSPLSDAAFERQCEELREAFSDLSEQELNTLINEAVTWARQSAPA